jgi:hypothetical protein
LRSKAGALPPDKARAAVRWSVRSGGEARDAPSKTKNKIRSEREVMTRSTPALATKDKEFFSFNVISVVFPVNQTALRLHVIEVRMIRMSI